MKRPLRFAGWAAGGLMALASSLYWSAHFYLPEEARAAYEAAESSLWYEAGSARSAPPVYVFVEPGCSWCQQAYVRLMELTSQGRISARWIVVGDPDKTDHLKQISHWLGAREGSDALPQLLAEDLPEVSGNLQLAAHLLRQNNLAFRTALGGLQPATPLWVYRRGKDGQYMRLLGLPEGALWETFLTEATQAATPNATMRTVE